MLVHVLVTVVLVDLQRERRHLGQHVLADTRVDERRQPAPRRRRHEEFHEFVTHPLGRDHADRAGHLRHRRERLGSDVERQLRAEACRAHHAQRVVTERDHRRRGCAQTPRRHVREAAVRVDEGEVGQPQRHRVDGEVATHEVVVERVAELDDRLARLAVVGVGSVRRDLDLKIALTDADRPESTPEIPHGVSPSGDDALGVLRARRRREVEIGRRAREESITHRPTDEGDLVARRREAFTQFAQHRHDRFEVRDSLGQHRRSARYRPVRSVLRGLNGGCSSRRHRPRVSRGPAAPEFPSRSR